MKAEGYEKLDQINFGQFLKIMGKRINNKKDDENTYLKNLFERLDINNNGIISLDDIKHIVLHSNEQISEEEIELLINNVDVDEDGFITFEEFLTFMKK